MRPAALHLHITPLGLSIRVATVGWRLRRWIGERGLLAAPTGTRIRGTGGTGGRAVVVALLRWLRRRPLMVPTKLL